MNIHISLYIYNPRFYDKFIVFFPTDSSFEELFYPNLNSRNNNCISDIYLLSKVVPITKDT